MALSDPGRRGLRRFVYDSRSAGKVEFVIPGGDELEVSDEVAAQFANDPHFKPVGGKAEKEATAEEPPSRPARKVTKAAKKS
jgi:hypothetical protein